MTGLKRARLGLLCATIALVAGTAAKAEEGVAFKDLLGQMGVIPKEKDPIRYRERAPLVLPPKMDLPAPAASETMASAHPEWPNDPDVSARKRRAADQRKPVTESDVRRMSERNPTLTIDEIRQGRSQTAEAATPGQYMSDRVQILNPDELRRGAKKDDDASANNAVVRRTLTDPPNAFRERTRVGQNNSASAPRIDQQQADANPMDWLTRKFRRNDDDE